MSERVERYVVEKAGGRLVVHMRQVSNGLGLALVCAGVLAVTWWFGPFGPETAAQFGGPAGQPNGFYWTWAGFFAVVFLLSLVAPAYRQDITITENEIVSVTSFFGWGRRRRARKALTLGIWTETIGGEGVVFPFRVHLLGADGRPSGIWMELQRQRSVESLIDVLRSSLAVAVKPEAR